MTPKLRESKQLIRQYLQTFPSGKLINLLNDARADMVPFGDPWHCLVGHRRDSYTDVPADIKKDEVLAYLSLAEGEKAERDTIRCTRLVPMILSEIRRRESLNRKDYQTPIDVEMEMEMIPCN